MVAMRKNAKQFEFVSEAELKKSPPKAQFKEGFDFKKVLRIDNSGEKPVAEFLSTGNISNKFFERQEYEVEAGRKEVPLLYEGIYDIMTDANFPKSVEINTLGAAGVIFEEITEGGEVKFASVGSTNKTIAMKHRAVGLEYTEDMFIYNQTWLFPGLERDFGNAYNAMLNHVHLAPIITATLTGQTTDGTALTSFRADEDIAIKYLRTVEAAIGASVDDEDNPRYGPYVLLCNTVDAMIAARALLRVQQEGISKQIPSGALGDAIGTVQQLIAYNGWSGNRGKKKISYAGVPSGTAFLVHIGDKRFDFHSKWKHQLRRQNAGMDIKRFILDAIIWDARFGTYAAPTRAVQKITWPGSGDGAS